MVLRICRRIFWILCFFLPVQKNKVVFQSYYGRGYGDNPKYIADALLQTGKKMDLVWVTNGKEAPNVPEGFRTVLFRGFRYIYEMSTARVWVDNSRKEYCMKKKGQYYMQTWHGGLGMKKVENMVPEKLTETYVRMAKRDAAQCDVMLSACETITKDYRQYFWYPEGEILQNGLPRNDRLTTFTAEDVAKIKQSLGVQADYKLMLYAPTFRNNQDLSVYDIDYKRLKNSLETRFGGEWRILLRLHPNIFKLSETIAFDDDVLINASLYPDMQELYMVADALITDYSSVIFDYLMIEKPSFLYASDIDEYREERDFYFDFEELPFPLAQNNDALEAEIIGFDETTYQERVAAFKKAQGWVDNQNASAAAADWIVQKLGK